MFVPHEGTPRVGALDAVDSSLPAARPVPATGFRSLAGVRCSEEVFAPAAVRGRTGNSPTGPPPLGLEGAGSRRAGRRPTHRLWTGGWPPPGLHPRRPLRPRRGVRTPHICMYHPQGCWSRTATSDAALSRALSEAARRCAPQSKSGRDGVRSGCRDACVGRGTRGPRAEERQEKVPSVAARHRWYERRSCPTFISSIASLDGLVVDRYPPPRPRGS